MELLLTVAKSLWPFLKESMFEGLSFGEWVKRNKSACIWLTMMIVMLLISINMGVRVTRLGTHIGELNTMAGKLTKERDALKVKYDTQLTEIIKLKQDLHTLQEAREEQDARVQLYQQWMENCGIDHEYEGEGFPACPTKKVYIKRTVTKYRDRPAPEPPPVVAPPPVERKPTFRERLRSIFGGSKKEKEST